jgi:hypothetical protein
MVRNAELKGKLPMSEAGTGSPAVPSQILALSRLFAADSGSKTPTSPKLRGGVAKGPGKFPSGDYDWRCHDGPGAV